MKPTPADYAKAEEEAGHCAIWELPELAGVVDPGRMRAWMVEALARRYAEARIKQEATSGTRNPNQT